MHVDFVAVDRARKVTVDVPIHLEGHAPGADEGGVIDQVLFTAEVEVLPLNVPDQLKLDISGMQIGDMQRLEDLPLPEGVTLLEDPESTIVSVSAPMMDVTEAEAAEEQAEGQGLDVETAEEAAANE
jgi:large subunit ribosomal protein L25